MGVRDFLAIHWEETNYVLSFGESLLEASRPLLRNLWGYGFLRRGRPGIRGKLVQIEPRLSVTASKADQWIPIHPGTDAALALGIAHWIIKEKKYDHDFVGHHTFGFEDWKDGGKTRMGFKTLVLNEYSPRQVAQITGDSGRDHRSDRPGIFISPALGCHFRERSGHADQRNLCPDGHR